MEDSTATNSLPHQQHELSFGYIHGKSITKIPENLYIPPDALEVFLEAFEGPLDLLLYLIRRQNIDILEINVARITHQYMAYVEAMDALQFELASEYLLMAALLAEIKSRMLLPRQKADDEVEEDPRANLILRLLEYERFKEAAESIDQLPRMNRDIFPANIAIPELEQTIEPPKVDIHDLLLAFADILKRNDLQQSHTITAERLSTRERMTQILTSIKADEFTPFSSLFTFEEGRSGVVVTFLALMELIKNALVNVVQSDDYGIIHVKANG